MNNKPIQITSKQQGQVLPLVTVFLLVISASMFYMFNSGQMVQEKIRLVNSSDASVYGGATRMARIWNFNAYANRSLVMNSMAIGHGIALASWLEQTAMAVKNIKDFDREHQQTIAFQLYPALSTAGWPALQQKREYHRMLMKAIVTHWWIQRQLGDSMGNMMDALEPEGAAYRDYGSIIRYMRKYNRLNYALEDGWKFDDQGGREADGGSQAEEDFYAKLLDKEGHTHDDVSYGIHFEDSAMQLRFKGEPIHRMIEVHDNEYADKEFLTERKWDRPVVYLLRVGPYTLPIKGTAKHRGSTEYVGQDHLGQASEDTLSIFWASGGAASWASDMIDKLTSGLFGGSMDMPFIPPVGEQEFGYARVYSHKDVDGIENDFAGASTDTPKAHNKAKKHTPPPFPSTASYNEITEWPLGAVPNYAEIGPKMLAMDDPIWSLTARNFRKTSATRTSAGSNPLNSNSVQPAGRLELYEGNTRDQKETTYSSISSAEVIFDRPVKRADGRHEIGDFFNPYWHVRMVNVSDEHRKRAQEDHSKETGLKLFVE